MRLPVGRELVGCAAIAGVVLIAGGKPPHPPAPVGETTEVDVWNISTGKFSEASLSVERKKVEAVAVDSKVLLSGGEIGHHPPSIATSHRSRSAGYSATVDIYDSATGKMRRPAELALARQYFGVASADGKAFFGGGFANDPSLKGGGNLDLHAKRTEEHRPLAGYRSNLVDVYNSVTENWSTTQLSTNRSNLAATSVMDRWVLFGGGTRQEARPDICGSLERSAVVDIYDTKLGTWSHECLQAGRTTMNAASIGLTAVFFGGPNDPVDLFTFAE
eukprot:SAG31_NODE_5260_length_2645_cov_1.747054_2_plen_275_part_00